MSSESLQGGKTRIFVPCKRSDYLTSVFFTAYKSEVFCAYFFQDRGTYDGGVCLPPLTGGRLCVRSAWSKDLAWYGIASFRPSLMPIDLEANMKVQSQAPMQCRSCPQSTQPGDGQSGSFRQNTATHCQVRLACSWGHIESLLNISFFLLHYVQMLFTSVRGWIITNFPKDKSGQHALSAFPVFYEVCDCAVDEEDSSMLKDLYLKLRVLVLPCCVSQTSNRSGLPVEVRDKFLAEEDKLEVPGSDANREYMTQVHEKQLAEGGSSYTNKPLNQKVRVSPFAMDDDHRSVDI